jgi:hypothetical protein
MFCHKCGKELPEGSGFCSGCGANIGSAPNTQSYAAASAAKPKKKKTGLIVGGLIILVIIIAIAAGGGGKDYILTVKSWKPLEWNSATYGQVISKYIKSASWKERKKGNVAYVDITGKINGNQDFKMVVKVTKHEDDPDLIWSKVVSVTVGENIAQNEYDIEEVILAMFNAYDMGYDSMSDYYDDYDY